jgi:hypothetical protein
MHYDGRGDYLVPYFTRLPRAAMMSTVRSRHHFFPAKSTAHPFSLPRDNAFTDHDIAHASMVMFK